MHSTGQDRKNESNGQVMDGARVFARSLHILRKSLLTIESHKSVQRMWLREDKQAEHEYDALAYRMQTMNIADQLDFAIKQCELWLSSDHAAEKEYLKTWWMRGHNDRQAKAEKSLKTFDEAVEKASEALIKLNGFRQYAGLPGIRKNDDFRELVDEMFEILPDVISAAHEASRRIDTVAYLGYQGGLRK